MNIASNPAVRAELDNLQLQFPDKALLTLDDYALLYGIKRQTASRHLRRRGIPFTKEGRGIYIATLDLAVYKAKHKAGGIAPVIPPPSNKKEELKRRRGFCQAAERKRMGG